jgi:hypothetical protein
MHYSYEIEVSTAYTASEPLVYPIKLASGTLKFVDFLFEVGDGYSTCLILWDRAKQLLPSNPDGFYAADGLLISASLHYDLDANDNDLYLIAWNRGGVYDHTVNVMLTVKGVEEPDEYGIMLLMRDTIERLIDLMRSVF